MLNTPHTKKNRYRSSGGKRLIEVRVRHILQLFDARDPAPFRERDLDDDFTEYIVASADEHAYSTPLKIMIYVSDPKSREVIEEEAVKQAIRTHFSYQIDLKRLQLSKIFKTGQLFLLIGLIGLFGCLSLAELLVNLPPSEGLRVLREGLIIFGWVSMWKPIELMLFDWYPSYDRIRLFRKLLNTEVSVEFDV